MLRFKATAKCESVERNRMNQKTLLIVAGGLAVAAFLLGFVPEYLKAKELDNQLGATRQQVNAERDKAQMDGLGLLCGYV